MRALAYAPDGRTLAGGGDDGFVRLWDATSGTERLARPVDLGGWCGQVTGVAFAPDGHTLAIGTSRGGVRLLSAARGDQLLEYNLEGAGEFVTALTAVAFSPDGQGWAAAFHRSIHEWHVGGNRLRRKLVTERPSWYMLPYHCLAYGPDGTLAAGEDNGVALWPPERVERRWHWPNGVVRALSFAPDGTALAVARARDVGIYELPGGERGRRRRVLRHAEEVRVLSFLPDSRTLLTGGDDWTLHLWDVTTGEERANFNWRLGPITALAVAPDGMTAAVAGSGREGVLVWDLEW
jgi:WD40 repeat protein